MQFGDFELFLVSDGTFRLDGGAMFGVVPKALWSKLTPPDEKNRCQLGLNCLVIKTADELIVVDTGVGGNFDDKFVNIFAIEKSTSLIAGLKKIGFVPADVTKVVQTHLHFDHCGGNCVRLEGDKLGPAFANAIYYFNKAEFEYANAPDPRSKASYLKHNWEAVVASGQLELLSVNTSIIPGVEVFVTGGHTENHQIVKVNSGGKTACFLADLVPTEAHLKIPYVMAYDLFPKRSMEVKERILAQAMKEEWLLVFEHSPNIQGGYLYEDEGWPKIDEVFLS